MPRVSVKVEGLEQAAEIPGFLEHGQRRWVEASTKRIGEAIADQAPHKSGRLRTAWRTEALSSTTGRISNQLIYAKVQDKGAYITPKSGKVLRFVINGLVVFAKSARVPGQKYITKGLRKRNQIVNEEFEKIMGHIA